MPVCLVIYSLIYYFVSAYCPVKPLSLFQHTVSKWVCQYGITWQLIIDTSFLRKSDWTCRSEVGWLVCCVTSQQHASVSQGRMCSDNFTCCHTEIEVADPTFYLTLSQYTPGRPVPALTLFCQAPSRIATGVPILKSQVWLDPEKSRASGIRTPDLPLSRQTP